MWFKKGVSRTPGRPHTGKRAKVDNSKDSVEVNRFKNGPSRHTSDVGKRASELGRRPTKFDRRLSDVDSLIEAPRAKPKPESNWYLFYCYRSTKRRHVDSTPYRNSAADAPTG